jgi:superfamily II DNA or RNA helicase
MAVKVTIAKKQHGRKKHRKAVTHMLDKAQSWADLRSRLSNHPPAERQLLFLILVTRYLGIAHEYRNTINNVWDQQSVPGHIRELLGSEEPNQAYTLIAQTHTNELWAIHCHYTDNDEATLSTERLETLMANAAQNPAAINYHIHASNCEKPAKKERGKSPYQYGFLTRETWEDLKPSEVHELITHPSKRETIQPLIPRPHQEDVIFDAHRHYVTYLETLGKLIMACGTGKSLVSYWISQKLNSRSIMIAVPSLELIRQTLKTWIRETNANKQATEWACICDDNGEDTEDEHDIGLPCMTNVAKITKWLQAAQQSGKMIVVFTTYHSGPTLSAAAKAANFEFDFGIFDEAHKTTGHDQKTFGWLIHKQNIAIKRRMFMTATEKIYVGKEENISSMDNPDLYGRTFHYLPFHKAVKIQPAILCDYQILILKIEKAEIQEFMSKNNVFMKVKGMKGTVSMTEVAGMIALEKAMGLYPISHVISYHQSIDQAEEFTKLFEAYATDKPNCENMQFFHISSRIAAGERTRRIQGFRHCEKGIITNARCLSEGIDIPAVNGILYTSGKNSVVENAQIAGRAVRQSPGKLIGYIIIPVATGISNEADCKSFDKAIQTLRALAQENTHVLEAFTQLYTTAAKQGENEYHGTPCIQTNLTLQELQDNISLVEFADIKKNPNRPFEEAREFSRGLGLQTQHEWKAYINGKRPDLPPKPEDIPDSPKEAYYSEGWRGWDDWLRQHPPLWRPFAQARQHVKKFKLQSWEEWELLCEGKLPGKDKLPSDIPHEPKEIYNNQWISEEDWISKDHKIAEFLEAREITRAYQFRNSTNYKQTWLRSRPEGLPKNPEKAYPNEWAGWNDWLGLPESPAAEPKKPRTPGETKTPRNEGSKNTGIQPDPQKTPPANPATPADPEFIRLRNTIRQMRFKSAEQYQTAFDNPFVKLPANAVPNPENVYHSRGWRGWNDFLGIIAEYRPDRRPELREPRNPTDPREQKPQDQKVLDPEYNPWINAFKKDKSGIPGPSKTSTQRRGRTNAPQRHEKEKKQTSGLKALFKRLLFGK